MASVVDKLLIAAFSCEQKRAGPFSAEDLVVSAWRAFPETFGLSGQPDQQGRPAYPDSNRVFAEIMGTKPIRARGYLVKVDTKMYSLTELGRTVARGLVDGGGVAGVADAGSRGMSREASAELKRMIGSRVYLKLERQADEEITFNDACLFWRITPHSSAIELASRRKNVEAIIQSASEELKGGRARFEHGRSGYSANTIELLRRAHGLLLDRFAGELATIGERRDQRSR